MSKKIKYGKIILVTIITILIWIFADRALDDVFTVSNAVINVTKSTNPDIWVSFNDESSISISELVLKGPSSRIAEVKRQVKEGSLALEFFLEPQQEKMTLPGDSSLGLFNFFRRSEQIRQLGLTVESCKPDKLTVNVVGLIKKALTVKCVDEDQNPVKTTSIEPAQVEMFVPKDWSGEKLIAKLQLTHAEIDQGRVVAIEKTPFVELAQGQIKEATIAVKVKIPTEEDRLADYTITTTTLGISLSANLQGKYEIEITNPEQVMGAISIRATPEAKHAFDKMRYQVILEIDDSDKDVETAEPLRRELVYNFPAEYIRKDEIRLKQQPVIVRFKLLLVTPAQIEQGAGR